MFINIKKIRSRYIFGLSPHYKDFNEKNNPTTYNFLIMF